MALATVILAPPTRLEITVDGVRRTGVAFLPAKTNGAPLMLCFHGHGGSARQAANSFRMHEEWPEAVVIYLDGLTGVSGRTDPEGKRTGWQMNRKDQGDRDIKFVDAVLTKAKSDFKVDTRRIYTMGHSNGSRFANVLWNQRGKEFAAFGFSGGQGGAMIRANLPRSIFVIAGEKDPLVPFQGQMLSVNAIKRLLGATNSKTSAGYLTTYKCESNRELATYLHPGGHEFPRAATKLMVEFFKRHKG